MPLALQSESDEHSARLGLLDQADGSFGVAFVELANIRPERRGHECLALVVERAPHEHVAADPILQPQVVEDGGERRHPAVRQKRPQVVTVRVVDVLGEVSLLEGLRVGVAIALVVGLMLGDPARVTPRHRVDRVGERRGLPVRGHDQRGSDRELGSDEVGQDALALGEPGQGIEVKGTRCGGLAEAIELVAGPD
jgi:hypothetical protein